MASTPSTTPALPEWLCPEYPPLRGSVGQAAVAGQNVYYPMVARSGIDRPVNNQSHGIVSIMMLETPQVTDKGTIYGFFKIRGNHADKNQAIAAAADIVRDQDSKSRNLILDVGRWLPLTNGQDMVETEVPVMDDAKNQVEKIRISKLEEEQKLSAQKTKEVEARRDEVMNAPDHNDDPESIEYFVMKRVNWNFLGENIANATKTLKGLVEARARTRLLLQEKLDAHPEYAEKWLEVYNAARAQNGIPPLVITEEMAREFAEIPEPPLPAASAAKESQA